MQPRRRSSSTTMAGGQPQFQMNPQIDEVGVEGGWRSPRLSPIEVVHQIEETGVGSSSCSLQINGCDSLNSVVAMDDDKGWRTPKLYHRRFDTRPRAPPLQIGTTLRVLYDKEIETVKQQHDQIIVDSDAETVDDTERIIKLVENFVDSDAETVDDTERVIKLAENFVDSDAETEDESAIKFVPKVTPDVVNLVAMIGAETDNYLEYCKGLFEQNMKELRNSIQEMEHHVHKLDRIVKQKLRTETPAQWHEPKTDPKP